MKNKAPYLVLIGAILFGLLASVSVTNYLANARGTNKQNTIVVASMEIPLGSKILAEQLTTVQMPQGATPEGTFSEVAKVVGRVAATRIAARETVINARLAPVGAAAGLSAIIPEGHRAMTVKVDDDSGMSGFVLPGTYVDVAAVINLASTGGGTISKIILQNIKVLANGDNLDEPTDKRDAQKARTVTLLVMPDQAEKLLLASTDGRLRLVMRNGADQNNQPTQGANVRSLLTGEGGLSAANYAALAGLQPATSPTPTAPPAASARQIKRLAHITAIVPDFNNAVPKPAPAPSRPPVEFFEGTKKRSVEFPDR
ncbi:MAG: Flp pilus assembly protein CpaB [Acidobacteria bacterium]|nr:Flp pilus assembly protein CpaB [Acidobacteriota bacterium]MBI3426332.1 Flp pilus assembly protein CpaB [Acidobacteriota bacterium]